MRKDQPKTKRQFVRKLFLLEERKVISRLTNAEIAGIVSCNEPLVSKARNNRLATKSSRKKSMTLESSEEEEVCEEIKQQYKDGKIVSPQTLRGIVEQKAGHSVGRSFHQSFLDRHDNELEMQIAKKRDEKRMNVKIQDIRSYIEVLKIWILGVICAFILQLDETGYQAYHDTRPQPIIVPKGVADVPAHMPADRSEPHFSLLAVISLSMEFFNPIFLLKQGFDEQQLINRGLRKNFNCYYYSTENGNMTLEVFKLIVRELLIPHFQYLRNEYNLPNQRGFIISDGCKCHVNHEVLQILADNNIALIMTLPNSTHYLQVLDLGVFGTYKEHFQQLRRNYHHDTLAELLQLSASAYQMSVCLETLVNSWQKGGIERDATAWPWRTKINEQKFDAIIKQCEKDNILSKQIGTRVIRKYKQSDFGVLNCDLLKDE
ncbi:MAG: hypothetical protein EZS28_003305 [Streblomastix strix]|uniref:DDE-1 domain-containing protein n=1 Tax=Streblomastix strix TaxID=222440 RepID=A0A5J4X1S3_9EUKA|nr:MAG: hypothetical protein EZS28_003305 [Streblomastix strix]